MSKTRKIIRGGMFDYFNKRNQQSTTNGWYQKYFRNLVEAIASLNLLSLLADLISFIKKGM
jgi:hypothetical protein